MEVEFVRNFCKYLIFNFNPEFSAFLHKMSEQKEKTRTEVIEFDFCFKSGK